MQEHSVYNIRNTNSIYTINEFFFYITYDKKITSHCNIHCIFSTFLKYILYAIYIV